MTSKHQPETCELQAALDSQLQAALDNPATTAALSPLPCYDCGTPMVPYWPEPSDTYLCQKCGARLIFPAEAKR